MNKIGILTCIHSNNVSPELDAWQHFRTELISFRIIREIPVWQQ